MSAAPAGTPAPAVPHAEHYAALAAEAAAIRGVSLWQDAWRRLRRNKAAMAALVIVLAVSVLAFIAPLLPLQSPIDTDLANRQFKAPNLNPVKLGERRELRFRDNSLKAELAVYRLAWSEHREALSAHLAATAARRAEANRLPSQERQAILDEIDKSRPQPPPNPVDKLWNNPGPLARLLIQARLALFGDWCVPSICGTDNLGRDVLSRVVWGARVSLIVGIVATGVSLLIGVSYGAIAGYLGGWVDNAMMRLVDVLYSVPFIFVVIFLVSFLSEDSIKERISAWHIDRIAIFYIVIGAIYWLTMSRVVRGQVISLKNEQFVQAAKTIGASHARIVFRHLIPNVLGVVIVYLSLTIPAVMLFEAFLSFLGMGVSPPDVSWGLLMNEGIQVITPLKTYWWIILFPGLALSLTLFALNFLGDGLRDALDPRMKNR